MQALLQHLLQRLQRGGERGVPSGAAAAQVALADELARLGRVGALVVQLLLGGVRRVPLIGTKGASARAAAAAPRGGAKRYR